MAAGGVGAANNYMIDKSESSSSQENKAKTIDGVKITPEIEKAAECAERL